MLLIIFDNQEEKNEIKSMCLSLYVYRRGVGQFYMRHIFSMQL